MSKMGLHDPFGHFKHKLWPKEGSIVKLSIWLPTTKSQESPQFPYVQVLCNIPLKSSQWRLQLCFRPHFIQRFARKIMSPKVVKVLVMGISRLPLGSPRTKWHLGAGLVAKHRIYYKGEGGGFLQVRATVNLVNLNLLMACLSTKSVSALH